MHILMKNYKLPSIKVHVESLLGKLQITANQGKAITEKLQITEIITEKLKSTAIQIAVDQGIVTILIANQC